MNRIHRIVWSFSRAAWVAVPEGARARGKGRSSSTVAASTLCGLALCSVGAWAQTVLPPGTLPTAGQVTAGNASIQHSGSTLQIDQSSQRAAIQWGTFNVGSAAQVQFNQPNAQAITLNRVLDSNASQIQGRISANGQVWLLNPNGVLFGKTANVDVGGLLASTHGISDASFMAGGNSLTEPARRAAVVNQGQLQARLGGYIALLAPEVRNEGVVVVPLGTAVLAAGETITLHLKGTGLAGISVTPSQLAALVENKGAVIAEEGLVILSARAVDNLLAGVVNHSGSISARGLTQKGGRILLEASSQALLTDRSLLDASSARAPGGDITVTAQEIGVLDNSRIHATGAGGGGSIHIGGEWQGGGATPQARAVYVAANTRLDASAVGTGRGGEIVVWSDVRNPNSATRVHGSLLANAGALGGDGGRIETSGRYVDVAGVQASATAPRGAAGQWLLDPYDLTVTASATNTSTAGGPPYLFTSGAGGTNVLNTDIQNQLNGGTSVTLRTSGTSGDGLGNGDITVAANIAKTNGTDATLTLQAHNNIVLNTGTEISSTNGKLHVVLNSDVDGTGGGAIALNTGSRIASNGGNITLGGGTAGDGSGFAEGNASLQAAGIRMTQATLDATGGDIALKGRGVSSTVAGRTGIYLNTNSLVQTSGAGTIHLTGEGGGGVAGTTGHNYGVEVMSSTLSGGNVGSVTLQGTGGVARGTDNIGVFISGTNARITTTGGNITVIGQGGGSGNASESIGILADGNSVLQAGGNGQLTLQGTGGIGTIGAHIGIDTSSLLATGQVTGGGGISFTGIGGTGGDSNIGLNLGAGPISATGANANVSLTGTGGTGTGNDNYGMLVQQGSHIFSSGGNVSLTGQGGGNGAGSGNIGVYLYDAGVRIAAAGSGNVTIQAAAGAGSTGNTSTGLLADGSTISTNAGSITLNGVGGAIATGANNQGIALLNGAMVNAGGTGQITATGVGGGTAGTVNHGIHATGNKAGVGSGLSTAGGAIDVTGTAGGGGTSYGVALDALATVATGGNAAASFTTDSINIATGAGGASVSAGTGTVTLRNRTAGTLIDLGGADVLAGAPLTLGLLDTELDRISAGTLVVGRTGSAASGNATVSSTITLGTFTDFTLLAGGDIIVNNGRSIDTVTAGNVILNSDADGSGSGAIALRPGSGVFSHGGNITMGGGLAGNGLGDAIGSTANPAGISLDAGEIRGAGGNIVMHGQGYAGAGNTNSGIQLLNTSAISTTGSGNLSLTGTGGAGTGLSANNDGVYMTPGTTIATDLGALILVGTGGVAGGGNNSGVFVDGGTISTVGGNMSVSGYGGGASGTSGNAGVSVATNGSLTTGGSGTLAVTGVGGNGSGAGWTNRGVVVSGANARIRAAAGAVTVVGTGADATVAGGIQDDGVMVDAGGVITSGGGDVHVSGRGGNLGNFNNGIYMPGTGTISAGGLGHVTVTGQGGAIGTGSTGISMLGGSTIATAGGNAVVTGTATGGATGGSNIGVSIESLGTITAGGSGSITVSGTGGPGSGGSNRGVRISGSGGGTTGIVSAGGAISVTGVATGDQGVRLVNAATIASGGNAPVSITTDSYNGDGSETVSAGSGTVTVQNRTAATLINLGGADVLTGSPPTLGLSAAELNRITAGTLVVGRNDVAAAGAITVSSAVNPALAANLSLLTGAGMAINAPLGASNTLTLTAGNAANVTQTAGGNVTAANLLLNGAGAHYALATAAANAVNVVAASGVGAVSYRNATALQVGTVGVVNGVSASGPVALETLNGNLTVAQNISTSDTSNAAILLNAGVATAAGTSTGGNILLAGNPGITTGSGGRTTLMTGSIVGSPGITALAGAGSGRFRYNSDESSTNYSTALGAGTYVVYREQPTVTVTANDASKTYDAAAYSGGNGVVVSGGVNGDAAALALESPAYTGNAQGAVNAGNYAITPGAIGAGLGYATHRVDGVLTVQKADLTLSGQRVYDGSTAMDGANLSANGVAGESFALSGTGTLGSKNVQSNQALAAVGSLALGASGNGGLAGNYNALATTASSVSITPATLGVSTANVGKTYDGSTSAPGAAAVVVSGALFAGDSLGGGSFAYSDKDAGAGNKTVTVAGVSVNDGNGGGNYTLSHVNNTTSTITPADITLSGGRVYDGSTAMDAASLRATGVAGETFVLSGAGTLGSKNVQSNQALAGVGSLALGASGNGGLASNYKVLTTTASTVSITPADITLTGSRVYDGSTAMDGANLSANGVAGESFALSGSGTLGSKNVQSNQALAGLGSLALGASGNGGQASNYKVLTTAGSAASITPRLLTVTYTGVDKMADGTTSATVLTRDDRMAGDVLSLQPTASFRDPHMGTGKPVDVTAVSMLGPDGGNYRVAGGGQTTASIQAAAGPNAGSITATIQPMPPASSPPSAPRSPRLTEAPAPGDNSPPVAASPATPDPQGTPTDPRERMVRVVLDRPAQDDAAGRISVVLPSDTVARGRTLWLPLPASALGCRHAEPLPQVQWLRAGQLEALPAWMGFDLGSCALWVRDVPEGVLPVQVQTSAHGKVTVVVLADTL